MEEEGSGEKLSELQLGIRELFRILVPGAYVMALLVLFAPQTKIVILAEKGTASLLVASLFFGLAGYAARVHERTFPYFRVFEKSRKELNDAIIAATGHGEGRDNVDVYKYFLETTGSELRERIHYFSSFYYMLVELSFISVISALYLVDSKLYPIARSRCAAASCFGFICLLLAIVGQVILLSGLSGLREKRDKILAVFPTCLAVVGSVVLAVVAGWPSFRFSFMENYPVPVFISLAFAFERLGAKHWKQIVGEQIVLVKYHAEKLKTISSKLEKRSGNSK
jgi:hypothetical protein